MRVLRLTSTISHRIGIANACGRVCPFLALGAVAILLILQSSPAQAQGEDLYTFQNLQVDATAKTASEARKLALAQGYTSAFQRLINRLVPLDRQTKLPMPDTDALAALVRDFEVEEEKTSTVRYLARLRIRFNRAAVQKLLRDSGVPYAETQSKPLLLLPVLHRSGAYLLWDRPNPWREAWSKLPASDGLLPLILPKGGLQDFSVISAEQAARGDPERLEAIARRYRVSGVLVAVAVLRYDPAEAVTKIDISVSRSNDSQGRTWRNTITGAVGESSEGLIARAAGDSMAFVQEQWKIQNLLRYDSKNEMVVSIPLESLGDWVRMRKRITSIGFVSKIELINLSRRKAIVRLEYLGEEGQLTTALAHSDLSLVGEPDERVLRYAPKQRDRPRAGTTGR